jgi:hypothetical protein
MRETGRKGDVVDYVYKFRCAIATALPIAPRSSILAPISSIKAITRTIKGDVVDYVYILLSAVAPPLFNKGLSILPHRYASPAIGSSK